MTPLYLAGDGQCLKCQSLGTPTIYQSSINRCAPNGNSWCCVGILVSLAFATAVAAQAASQIGYGPVQQISDGQVLAATSVAPVTQITDGQIQTTTSAPAPVITDGQIQAPPEEGGENCCATNLTTSIDRSGRSATAGTSLLSTTTLSTSPLFSSLTSTAALTLLSTTAATPRTSIISLTGSLALTILQGSGTVPTSLAQLPTAMPKNDTILGIAVGVPLAIFIVLLAVVAFFLYQQIRKHELGLIHLQHAAKGDPLPEMNVVGAQPVAELDITHYELNHPDAPQHELP